MAVEWNEMAISARTSYGSEHFWIRFRTGRGKREVEIRVVTDLELDMVPVERVIELIRRETEGWKDVLLDTSYASDSDPNVLRLIGWSSDLPENVAEAAERLLGSPPCTGGCRRGEEAEGERQGDGQADS